MTEQLQEIKSYYEKAFQKLNNQTEIPEINVEFYPYIGINQTIRLRNGKVFVRLAEVCRDLSAAAQNALAIILVSKLLGRKISPAVLKTYREAVKNQELNNKVIADKRARGRKVITTSKGEIYDLEQVFGFLNQIYFDNKITKPTLSWSARKTYRILGHHDSTHETIIVSKSLDERKVPKYVVEFVLFHEMLHIFHPTENRNGRRYSHTPQFRRDEKKFAFFVEAETWIEQNIKHLRRNAKRK